jgi:hypothetical protein
MPIIREPYPPKPKITLEATCEACGFDWNPYEDVEIRLPHEVNLRCPECGEYTLCFYPDAEMNKEILHRRYVLGYDEKITNAQTKNETLTKERDEWKERHDKLFENNTKLSIALDKLATKLDQLGVEVDNNDRNPLTG